jgi:hypothetical protein
MAQVKFGCNEAGTCNRHQVSEFAFKYFYVPIPYCGVNQAKVPLRSGAVILARVSGNSRSDNLR